jgi:hypothetical protein
VKLTSPPVAGWVVRLKDNTSFSATLRGGNIRLPARSVVLTAEGRMSRFGRATYDSDNRLRGGDGECSIGAAQLLVPVVEVEEDFAHIAAMSGMASGDVLGRDGDRRTLAKLCDELLDERAIGKYANKCRQRSRSVGGDEEAAFRAAAEAVELPAGEAAELFVAIDEEEGGIRLRQLRPEFARQAALAIVECDEMNSPSGGFQRRLYRG